MAYSRHLFSTDSDRPAFRMFEAPKVSKTRLHVTTALQLFSIFFMLRVAMVAGGMSFIQVPFVDNMVVSLVGMFIQ